MVLPTVDLDDFFFKIFNSEVLGLNEGFSHAGSNLVVDPSVTQLAKGGVAEAIDGTRLQ